MSSIRSTVSGGVGTQTTSFPGWPTTGSKGCAGACWAAAAPARVIHNTTVVVRILALFMTADPTIRFRAARRITHNDRVVPRVRFAPSPTGYLHVGGARTALFNWLYARRHGGTFILRIEDTDVERSQPEMVTGILDGLRWLGIDWDEGPEIGGPHAPYFQSGRLDRYRAAAKQLLDSGQAFLDEGAVRFKVPPGKTAFTDNVHGPIEFNNEHIENFVVLRSDTHPTYHLSVVVDDIDMAVTHVVRGDDHISNTPKQVLLYNAFGKTPPAFAHVPLIMGPDKKRLSKRHGATSEIGRAH